MQRQDATGTAATVMHGQPSTHRLPSGEGLNEEQGGSPKPHSQTHSTMSGKACHWLYPLLPPTLEGRSFSSCLVSLLRCGWWRFSRVMTHHRAGLHPNPNTLFNPGRSSHEQILTSPLKARPAKGSCLGRTLTPEVWAPAVFAKKFEHPDGPRCQAFLS